MADDFKKMQPVLGGSVSRGGEIDWEDESTKLSLWPKIRDDGKIMFTGKVGGDPNKSVVVFWRPDTDRTKFPHGWKIVPPDSDGDGGGSDGDGW